ncbi:MAG: hypothetical protein RIC12_00135, partial [Pirellulales bacterium]
LAQGASTGSAPAAQCSFASDLAEAGGRNTDSWRLLGLPTFVRSVASAGAAERFAELLAVLARSNDLYRRS